MTSQEKDKFICEKLGVCWHEYKVYPESHENGPQYGYCTNQECLSDYYGYGRRVIEISKMLSERPDFTSEAGRVQLLKLIWELPELPEFLYKNYHGYAYNLIGFIKDLKDDTGLFRNEVFRWFEGERRRGHDQKRSS